MTTYFRAPTNDEIRAKAERKRQALIAETCSEVINMLLDDTGPLAQLAPEIRALVNGDIQNAVRTLTKAMDEAEEKSEES